MPVNPTLPTEGGSKNAWGGLLNTALTAIVSFVNTLETTVSGKAAASHTHVEGDVTGLAGSLSGKSDVGHAHSAADITTGTLPVARGGTGVTTIADLRTALGLGLGAAMSRVSTANADTASGSRTMTGYDTTDHADTGYTVDRAAGTITVPADGVYAVVGHARFSAAYTGGQVRLAVNNGTTDVLLGLQLQASAGFLETEVSGLTPWITAGTALRLVIFTTTSTSLVGDAASNYYTFRLVRAG